MGLCRRGVAHNLPPMINGGMVENKVYERLEDHNNARATMIVNFGSIGRIATGVINANDSLNNMLVKSFKYMMEKQKNGESGEGF